LLRRPRTNDSASIWPIRRNGSCPIGVIGSKYPWATLAEK
jgi:hypothetical protein